MKGIKALFFLGLGISFFPEQGLSAEPAVIRLHLFQGIRADDQAGLSEVQNIPIASRPEFAAIKTALGRKEATRTGATLDTLLNVYNLQAIDDLFFHEAGWDGKTPFREVWIFGKTLSYRINLVPKRLSPLQLAVRVAIDKVKTSERSTATFGAETIVTQDLVLDYGEPILIGLPNPAGDYFLMAWASSGTLEERKPTPPNKETIFYVTPPKARNQILPSFPRELQRRNLAGRIGLRITIDEKGSVRRVDIEKPLHAYLNYAAVQAFRQWTFEPVQLKGKSVLASFRYGYDFNPWFYLDEEVWAEAQPSGADTISQVELERILEKAAEYCRTLASVVSDYVCEESIQETHYDLLNSRRWSEWAVFMTAKMSAEEHDDDRTRPTTDWINSGLIAGERDHRGRLLYTQMFQSVDPRRDKRNVYLCDYQIYKKAGAVEEHRTILKENRRKPADPKKILKDRRFSALGSFFAPLRVLAKDRQPKFIFGIAGEEKVNGKKALILTASPKSDDENGIRAARIWVDKASFQVMKCEIEGVPIDGHEDILNECASLNIRPLFLMTHEYEAEKKGVLFPWRSEVLVAYPGIDPGGPLPRLKIFMNYDKYKFFTVDTESGVIR